MRRLPVALLAVSCAFGADFVGNKSCAPCHAAIFGAYMRTPMAQSSGKVGTQDQKETFDRAEFRDDRGAFSYTVKSIQVTDPDWPGAVEQTPEPVVTLITCFPFEYIGSAPRRFIVRATLDR